MIRLTRDSMIGEIESFFDETTDVAASRCVHAPLAFLSHGYQPGQPQLGEVLARSRRSRSCRLGQGADVALTAAENEQNPEPGGIGEQHEGADGGLHLGRGWQRMARHRGARNILSFAHTTE
jgi:hypothetical protein